MSDPSFTIDVGGDDYLIVHKIGGFDITQVYEEGASEAIMVLSGLYAEDAATAIVRGFRYGMKSGITIGAAQAQASIRTALGLASLEDVSKLDTRVEQLEGQQRHGF